MILNGQDNLLIGTLRKKNQVKFEPPLQQQQQHTYLSTNWNNAGPTHVCIMNFVFMYAMCVSYYYTCGYIWYACQCNDINLHVECNVTGS